MTYFLQLGTKLQDLKKKKFAIKLQRCWGNAKFKAAHATESDVHVHYCMKAKMVQSSSQLDCQHSLIYYHKGRLVQHFHYLVHV